MEEGQPGFKRIRRPRGDSLGTFHAQHPRRRPVDKKNSEGAAFPCLHFGLLYFHTNGRIEPGTEATFAAMGAAHAA